jgi:hypothetical protein
MVISVVIGIGLLVLLSLAVLTFGLSVSRISYQRSRRDNRDDQELPPPHLSLGEQKMIQDLVDEGRKIEAIKHYRLLTGCSLKMAKEQVERIGRGLW